MSELIIRNHNSLYGLVEEAGLPATRFMDHSSDRESLYNHAKQSWDFGLDLTGSIKMATHGWPEGTE